MKAMVSQKQYASHCDNAAAGSASMPNCAVLDTVILAVSIFIFTILFPLVVN